MYLKTKRAFKDRRRSISVVKMAGTNPNGRYQGEIYNDWREYNEHPKEY